MPASEAQIRANQANAAKSTGPRTAEGKAASRANSYKHGMTGNGVVMPPDEAEAVDRRYAAFYSELQPADSLGMTLLKRAATLAVRMEKCAERDMAERAERVTRAIHECDIPTDLEPAEATRLRAEAGRKAAFDPSKEATLARNYEAAAERGFFRALKEFRLAQQSHKARTREAAEESEAAIHGLGSILQDDPDDAEFLAQYPEFALPAFKSAYEAVFPASPIGQVDVPISIGKSR